MVIGKKEHMYDVGIALILFLIGAGCSFDSNYVCCKCFTLTFISSAKIWIYIGSKGKYRLKHMREYFLIRLFHLLFKSHC